MAEIFYQGEDIHLSIELFDDDAMNVPVDLSGSDAELLLYTRRNGYEITASTLAGKDVAIERESATRLSAKIGREWTAKLAPGPLTCEMRLTDSVAEDTRIAVITGIRIEPSKIGHWL